MKKDKGITLIALVIICIMLLILAGVGISVSSGESGVLTIAKKVEEKTNQEILAKKEEIKKAQDEMKESEDMTKAPDEKVIDFTCTQEAQEWTVLVTGRYKLEVWGAQGGSYSTNQTPSSGSGSAGKGGYSEGIVKLTKGLKLYIYVGQAGNNNIKGTGGWNGGGNSRQSSDNLWNGGSGGGATDIRIINGEWNDTNSLNSRIIVAGGGGGLCHWNLANAGNGGGASGTLPAIYTSSNTRATSGTQTSAGTLGYYSSAEANAPYTAASFGTAGNFNQTTSGNYEASGGRRRLVRRRKWLLRICWRRFRLDIHRRII